MKRDMILKLAASTMMISVSLSGCGPESRSVASASSKPVPVKDGAKYAKKASKALAKGKIDKAIAYAERSVAAVGTDPETRALLGHSYMAAGRFSSAERSFKDAVELGKTDARTVLSLTMAQLGLGKANDAKRSLSAHRQYIPTADYGLALALTGDSKTAVELLEQAIRRDDVTSRTRQNLGLAYALDGRWREAKLIASQDVQPAVVNERMTQWAQMARPGAYQTRVATLLNVSPVAGDPGQPVRLALNAAPPTVAAAPVAPAQDYSREVASFDRDTPLPAIGPAPRKTPSPVAMPKEKNVKVTKVALPASKPVVKTTAPKPVAAPVIKASKSPARVAPTKKFIVEGEKPSPKKAVLKNAEPKPVKLAQATPVKTPAVQAVSAVKPILQKVAFTPKPRKISSGTHLVQLGAFSSAEGAKRAWNILSSKNKDLAAFQYASSRVNVKGKTLYRLAAMGFGNAQSAKDMCVGIKAKGGSCIVRHVKGVNKAAPVRMAAGKPKKLAAR